MALQSRQDFFSKQKAFLDKREKIHLQTFQIKFLNGIFLIIFVGTIAPAREIPGDESEVDSNEKFMKALQYFFTNVNLVLPVVAAVVVIVSAIVFICVFRSRHTQMLAGKMK